MDDSELPFLSVSGEQPMRSASLLEPDASGASYTAYSTSTAALTATAPPADHADTSNLSPSVSTDPSPSPSSTPTSTLSNSSGGSSASNTLSVPSRPTSLPSTPLHDGSSHHHHRHDDEQDNDSHGKHSSHKHKHSHSSDSSSSSSSSSSRHHHAKSTAPMPNPTPAPSGAAGNHHSSDHASSTPSHTDSNGSVQRAGAMTMGSTSSLVDLSMASSLASSTASGTATTGALTTSMQSSLFGAVDDADTDTDEPPLLLSPALSNASMTSTNSSTATTATATSSSSNTAAIKSRPVGNGRASNHSHEFDTNQHRHADANYDSDEEPPFLGAANDLSSASLLTSSTLGDDDEPPFLTGDSPSTPAPASRFSKVTTPSPAKRLGKRNKDKQASLVPANDADPDSDGTTSFTSYSSSTTTVAAEMTPKRPETEPPQWTPLAEKVMQFAWKDWNGEFQQNLDLPDSYDKHRCLVALAHDFVYAATTYGKIIIAERHLPTSLKTIPSSRSGGLAGGDKFVCHSIFFKFATDSEIPSGAKPANPGDKPPTIWMYGGHQRNDTAAMKAAAHDLKGLTSFYNTKLPGVHFPLMALITYRGYRLVAMSILPIGKQADGESTLCYGSCDGGKTVVTSDLRFNRYMEQMGKMLNLKEHVVMHHSLFGPADIEGHVGRDGKYYLLDFARTFPPEAPLGRASEEGSRTVFYQHLRPEFLRRYSIPLSSDAFTGFGSYQRRIHDKEVLDATLHLHNNVIPSFSAKLDKFFQAHAVEEAPTTRGFAEAKRRNLANYHQLTEELHRHGINCRHTGRVREHCTTPEARAILLTEMVVRSQKNHLNLKQRTAMATNVNSYNQPTTSAILAFLSLVLGGTKEPVCTSSAIPCGISREDTDQYWRVEVKEWIEEFFPFGLTPQERSPEYDLRLGIRPVLWFERLQATTGLKFSDRLMREVMLCEQLPTMPVVILPSDLESIDARVSHLNVIDEAEANALFYEALNYKGPQPDQLWNLVNIKFAVAVKSWTCSHLTLFQWATALFEQAKRREGRDSDGRYESTSNLLLAAEKKLAQAVIISPSFAPAWFLLGNVLIESGCCVIPFYSPHQRHFFLRAYDCYKKAMQLDPTLITELSVLARVRLEQSQLLSGGDERQQFFLLVGAVEQYRCCLRWFLHKSPLPPPTHSFRRSTEALSASRCDHDIVALAASSADLAGFEDLARRSTPSPQSSPRGPAMSPAAHVPTIVTPTSSAATAAAATTTTTTGAAAMTTPSIAVNAIVPAGSAAPSTPATHAVASSFPASFLPGEGLVSLITRSFTSAPWRNRSGPTSAKKPAPSPPVPTPSDASPPTPKRPRINASEHSDSVPHLTAASHVPQTASPKLSEPTLSLSHPLESSPANEVSLLSPRTASPPVSISRPGGASVASSFDLGSSNGSGEMAARNTASSSWSGGTTGTGAMRGGDGAARRSPSQSVLSDSSPLASTMQGSSSELLHSTSTTDGEAEETGVSPLVSAAFYDLGWALLLLCVHSRSGVETILPLLFEAAQMLETYLLSCPSPFPKLLDLPIVSYGNIAYGVSRRQTSDAATTCRFHVQSYARVSRTLGSMSSRPGAPTGTKISSGAVPTPSSRHAHAELHTPNHHQHHSQQRHHHRQDASISSTCSSSSAPSLEHDDAPQFIAHDGYQSQLVSMEHELYLQHLCHPTANIDAFNNVECLLLPNNSRCKLSSDRTQWLILAYPARRYFALTLIILELFEESIQAYGTPECVEVYVCDDRADPLMKRLKYEDDWSMNQDPDLDGYTAQKNTSDSVDAIQEQIGIALTAHDAHCNDKPIAQLAARFDKLNSQAGKATVFSSRIGTPCVGKYVLIKITPSTSGDPYMVLKYIGLRGFQVHSRAKSLQEIDENTRELSSLEHRRFHGLLTSAAEQQGAYLSVLLRASGFSPALGHIAKYHLSTETRTISHEPHCYSRLDFKKSPLVDDFVITIASQFCRGVTEVNLESCRKITDRGLAPFLASHKGLVALNLENCNQLGDTTVTAIVSNCTNLKRLTLWSRVSAASLLQLRTLRYISQFTLIGSGSLDERPFVGLSKQWGRLCTHLNLSRSPNLTDRCLQAIAQHCVSLKSLYLEDCAHITDEGVVALQNCKHLRSLSLADNRNISSGCIAKLLQTISFKRLLLRKLDLRNSAVIALESASESLQVLDLSYNNRISDTTFSAIAQAGTSMRTLQLCNSKVTNESIQLFALYHTELSVLELDGCIYIDDSALYSLHRCSKLRSLSLSGIDNVTDKGVVQLAISRPSLRYLNVNNCKGVTASCLQVLQTIAPNSSLNIVGIPM